ncbi:hypothetical protein DUNSADRAFT_10889 [Dunaliella salina]|uniref:Uncharacterized protein n=1 Tax=Dunaliella salina TaxID=3046 RepID=A0ABQ7H4P1_DUNSA|nr:hypothetical protein DUNSADRAFT_10889 [Dunaliella salina]|eukprot:KAF5841826.1 hypothetical protein DUNSADRAFT_10889 [Dunaliella salina]
MCAWVLVCADDEGEAEGWVMDAAIAAANAAASTLASIPSAAAAALSSQSKYVRAAAMVGGSVPSLEALREMLQQARGNVPSREAVREMLHSAYLQYVGGWAGGLPARGTSSSNRSSSSSSSSSHGHSGSKCGGTSGDSSSGEGFVVDEAEGGFCGGCGNDVCNGGCNRGARRWGWDGSMDGADGGGSGKEGGLEGFVAAVLAELRRRALKGGAAMSTRWRHPQHAQHAQRVVSATAADDLRSACDEAALAARLEGGGDSGAAAPSDGTGAAGVALDEADFAASLEGPLAVRHKKGAGAAREPRRRSLCLDARGAVTQGSQGEECIGQRQWQWQRMQPRGSVHLGAREAVAQDHQGEEYSRSISPPQSSPHASTVQSTFLHSPIVPLQQPWRQMQQQGPQQHPCCATQQHQHYDHQHSHQHNASQHLHHHHRHGHHQTRHPGSRDSQEGTGLHVSSSPSCPSPHMHQQRESPHAFNSDLGEQWFDAMEGDGDDECTAVLDAHSLDGKSGGS